MPDQSLRLNPTPAEAAFLRAVAGLPEGAPVNLRRALRELALSYDPDIPPSLFAGGRGANLKEQDSEARRENARRAWRTKRKA